VDAITSISADTGTSGSDFITSTASQTVNGTFTGTLNGGENIQVSADNGVTWVNATVGSGTWSASVTLSTGAGTLKTQTIDGSGNVLSGATHSYNLDQTNPTTGTVRDGSTTDIDTQLSLTTISANWSGFADPGSGINGYQWAIGTTPGGTDVQGYTSVGASTSATNSSLSLTVGTTYYVSVKATDKAGNVSSASVSDGVQVVSAATKNVIIKNGNNQKNTVGTSFNKPLQLVVRNVSDNKRLPKKPVTLTIVTAGNGAGGFFKVGQLKKQSITVLTNKKGIATIKNLFSNHIAGSFTITITIGAETSTTVFTETNRAGKPAHLAATGGGGQSTSTHTSFADPLQVTVTDKWGNVVVGAHVIFFTPTAKDAFFQVGLKQKTFVTVTTDSSGVATSPVPQAGGKAGTYKIVAILGNLHVGFTETNTP
jgi:hypothetical protein